MMFGCLELHKKNKMNEWMKWAETRVEAAKVKVAEAEKAKEMRLSNHDLYDRHTSKKRKETAHKGEQLDSNKRKGSEASAI